MRLRMTGFIETHVYLRGYSNYEKNYKFCHLPFFESQCLDIWDKPQQRGSGDDPSLNYKGPKKMRECLRCLAVQRTTVSEKKNLYWTGPLLPLWQKITKYSQF